MQIRYSILILIKSKITTKQLIIYLMMKNIKLLYQDLTKEIDFNKLLNQY